MRRRLVTVLAILAIVAAAWSAGWFALAAWADGRVGDALREAAERGLDVDCADRDVIGFPFALKVACGATEVAERSGGGRAELAGITGGASVLAPLTAAISLKSPARLETPQLRGPAAFVWDDAELGVGFGLNGPQSLSFSTDELRAELPIPEAPDATLGAASAQGSLTPQDGGSDASLAFTGLTLSGGGKTYPAFDGRASAWVSAPPRALAAGRGGLQAPLSARDVRLALTAGAARLEVEGEGSVDAEGILDGTMVLRVGGAEALPALIAQLPAEQQKLGNAVAGAMLAFGKPTTLDGAAANELQVEVTRGEARIGPVSITLPRLPL